MNASKIAMKVKTGEVVSAIAVGSIKLFFKRSFLLLDNVFIVSNIKRNLILVAWLMVMRLNHF